jgi:hypothetical protein
MSTVIYQASKDENGAYKNGKAGDQTGQEVYARSWYNRPWTAVYRRSGFGDKIAAAGKAGAENDNIGYDQNQRNTALTQARKVNYDLSKITVACETDCSAFACLCCMYAGVPESTLYKNGNSMTSSTIGDALKGYGFTELTDSKYLTSSDYLMPGDILVYKGHHVAINGTYGAKVTGAKLVTSNATSSGGSCPYKEPTDTLKKGDSGTGVSWLQWHLNTLIDKKIIVDVVKLDVDGKWGDKTATVFKAFQTKYPETGTNNKPDGKCGAASRKKLKSLV